MAKHNPTLGQATKPYRSSRLALPPSPFSPQFPLTALLPPPLRFTAQKLTILTTPPPPPPNPLKWLWQCHQCSRIYALGITRRCLDDGHYFCAGTPVWKRDRKTGRRTCKKSKACASEFDYAGWKARGNWRRGLEATEPGVKEGVKDCVKDCGRCCDYPSECRWGKQYGVAQTSAQETAAAAAAVPVSASSTTFDDILTNPTTPDLDLAPPPAAETNTAKPSLDDLLTSVKRRKRLSTGAPPSPLAAETPSVSVEVEKERSARALQKAFGDFELDVRKSFGRAGELAVSVVLGLKTRKGSEATVESDGDAETKSLGDWVE